MTSTTMGTDRERIAEAFKELRGRGYFARAGWNVCCSTCAAAEVPRDKTERAVFYLRRDADAFDCGRLRKTLWLKWGGDANEIVGVLRAQGLKASWNGDRYTCIEVNPAEGA